MAKIKAITKEYQLIVKVKLSLGEKMNLPEADVFSRKKVRGLFEVTKFNKSKIEYKGPVGISLCERFKLPIAKSDVFYIIEQIFQIIHRTTNMGFNSEKLILDSKYVYFNEMTKEVFLMLLPCFSNVFNNDIQSFIENIIYSVKPLENSTNYLSDFISYIKELDRFDILKVERYIKQNNNSKLFGEEYNDQHKRDSKVLVTSESMDSGRKIYEIKDNHRNDFFIDDDATDIVECNSDVYRFEGKDVNREFNRHSNECEEVIDISDDDVRTNMIFDDAIDIGNDETELCEDSCINIKSDDGKKENKKVYPVLIRRSNEEMIRIDKPVFRIGKEERCVDYVVKNNATISRSHADIICRGERYFIFDLESKNKTYVNDRVILAKQEVEIFNGDILRLAREEFIFRV